MSKRALTILGSTGSIGTQALDVVRAHPAHLRVEALSAGANVDLLLRQVAEFHPKWVHLTDERGAERLRAELSGTEVRVLSGPSGLHRIAAEPEVDMVVVATVGWTGVEPTLEAIEAGREIALANKEVLVCAGDIVMEAARRCGVTIWPLDSEHNAIMQCLAAGPVGPRAPLRRIILTCSGGPYRNASAEEIQSATVDRTLDHPTWDMGRKITVDSATLMNKGFEIIEAHHLFDVPLERLQVIIHPQSIIHSIVEYTDGSMIAQMGQTDMRLPIQNILTQPHRRPTMIEPLDLAQVARLDFSEPDMDRFPCLRMAYDAAARGGSVPCVLNAANEVAVQAHLDGRIPVGAIARVIGDVLGRHDAQHRPDLDALRAIDRWGRRVAAEVIENLPGSTGKTETT
ncbi:1-deoxy-D-xylulose-5-phosphate reductoisomerase [bacterium]|nr:1-deoxy-D-xylulose-5-phosphate reductoisomerase [bacterium]